MFFRSSGILIAFVYLLLSSCKGKDEPIPSYIHVDSASITASGVQGNEIHDLKFIYAYIDGELLGVFELPATIPVLKDGKHIFTVSPAVALNGSSSQVSAHTGFLPADTAIELTRGKITIYSNPVYSFRPNSNFVWIEDFEDNSSSISGISVAQGDTFFIADAAFDVNGRFSGTSKVLRVLLSATDTAKYIDIGSFKAFNNLPNTPADVFLEFDILSDIPVQLALKRTNSTSSVYVPYLYMYSTENKWKHFYVNLNYETSGQAAQTTYQIIFSSNISPSSNNHIIQLDNIRLSYNN